VSPRGRQPFEPTPPQRHLLRRVERAAARLRTAQTANTDAVRAALDDGIPAQVVADAAGLGVNTVRRIKYQAGVDD